MTPTHLALTLGPIENTLNQARSTRELWAASYLFSALMRELIDAFGKEGLLSPIVDGRPQKGAGIYPDRCFFELKGQTATPEKIEKAIDAACQKLVPIIGGEVSADDLKAYFRVAAATIVFEKKQDGDSPILQLNNLLDGLELQTKMQFKNLKLAEKLGKTETVKLLYKDAKHGGEPFIKYKNEKGFELKRLPSLPEIASSELKKGDPEKYKKAITDPTNQAILAEEEKADNSIFELKKEFADAFKFRHKYVCFVLADGDRMGSTLEKIGGDAVKIGQFSKALAGFAQASVQKVIDFGGLPIYAGGDDLLFVAPIQNENQEHIFHLLKSLDVLFPKDEFHKIAPDAKKTSLSFGLSISFYKYPMAESLDEARKQLFEVAKNVKGKNGEDKNAVAFRVLKHSGTAFGTAFQLSKDSFSQFQKLLEKCRDLDQAFLTSVMHRLQELPKLLEDALKNDATEFFFKRHFNEDIHRQNAFDEYLKAVRELTEKAWAENPKTAFAQVFAALRFVQFLNQEDHD